MKKRVIINADDFGLSKGVNQGILESFRDGILSSTTMMVNMDYFDEAVDLAKANPELDVGIHLNLLWGKPVSPPEKVASLIDEDGCFPPSLVPFLRKYGMRKLKEEDLRIELTRQIQKFLDSGLPLPSHVDTHKHIHALPRVLKVLLEVLKSFGIKAVRFPLEQRMRLPPGETASRPFASRVKRWLIACACQRGVEALKASGMRTTDHFLGIDFMDELDADGFACMLKNLQPGTTEIMCHPGYADETLTRLSRNSLDRETECEGLKAPELKRIMEEEEIELITYRDL